MTERDAAQCQRESAIDTICCRPDVVVITGPTGGGKTRLGIALARRFCGEIINADSVQVYRDFDIGSSTPDELERAEVPHHLFSIVSPEQPFDAGAFVALARKKIEEIDRRKVLPIVVGGTGLYIRSLLCGLAPVEAITETARNTLAQWESGIAEVAEDEKNRAGMLHRRLIECDPDTARKLHPADLSRVRRALLVYLSTGKSLAQLQSEHGNRERPYRALVVALLPEREKLYSAVDQRVDWMLDKGLVEEVEALRRQYPLSSRPFGAIGYRHVSLYLDGKLDYAEMLESLKRDTRRFAKRQITWWRNQPKALGWQWIEDPVMTLCADKSGRGISEHLIRIIEDFLKQKSFFAQDDLAFLPLENVDLV